VEKTVAAGIQISPKMPGSWLWVSDKELEFTPRNDWPMDQRFTVSFSRKKFFASGAQLEDYWRADAQPGGGFHRARHAAPQPAAR